TQPERRWCCVTQPERRWCCVTQPERRWCCDTQPERRWCDVKIPTLTRPTQEGCKAGRGPAGRETLHQRVEDGIYWVQ
ncbi:hypothetical protein AVEN_240036-1, partial [Araneus ventricosus]